MCWMETSWHSPIDDGSKPGKWVNFVWNRGEPGRSSQVWMWCRRLMVCYLWLVDGGLALFAGWVASHGPKMQPWLDPLEGGIVVGIHSTPADYFEDCGEAHTSRKTQRAKGIWRQWHKAMSARMVHLFRRESIKQRLPCIILLGHVSIDVALAGDK